MTVTLPPVHVTRPYERPHANLACRVDVPSRTAPSWRPLSTRRTACATSRARPLAMTRTCRLC